MQKLLSLILSVLCIALFAPSVFGKDASIEDALKWLKKTQNSDGSTAVATLSLDIHEQYKRMYGQR